MDYEICQRETPWPKGHNWCVYIGSEDTPRGIYRVEELSLDGEVWRGYRAVTEIREALASGAIKSRRHADIVEWIKSRADERQRQRAAASYDYAKRFLNGYKLEDQMEVLQRNYQEVLTRPGAKGALLYLRGLANRKGGVLILTDGEPAIDEELKQALELTSVQEGNVA